MSDPITREETYLAALSGEAVSLPDPITRNEMYLAYLCGMDVNLPAPITRKDYFMYTLCQQGVGGGGVAIRNQDKTITENGSYTADSGYTGLGTVTVNVPQEDPVVEPLEVTENGTYNPPTGVDGYGPVTVNVETSGGSGGGDDVARAIVERTITEYNNSEGTNIGEYAFYRCVNLETVNVPNLVAIGQNAFNMCSALKNVSCDKVTKVDSRAFAVCTALETISLPLLAGVTLSYGFDGCSALKNVHIPKVERLSVYAFRGCSSLETLDLPSVTKFDGGVFNYCTKLKTLILRTGEVIALSNVSIFSDTPFASGGTGGVLLIPSALVTAYTEATNWSAIYGYGTNRFLALEDYTVDGTITGEIDWDKVNALFEEASA